MSHEPRIVRPTRRDLENAEKLFRSFSGHELERYYEIKMPEHESVFAFGEVWGIGYTTMRDGKVERYLHEFEKPGAGPIIAADPKGTQLYLIGGNYRFTSRGIVDK